MAKRLLLCSNLSMVSRCQEKTNESGHWLSYSEWGLNKLAMWGELTSFGHYFWTLDHKRLGAMIRSRLLSFLFHIWWPEKQKIKDWTELKTLTMRLLPSWFSQILLNSINSVFFFGWSNSGIRHLMISAAFMMWLYLYSRKCSLTHFYEGIE